MDILLRVLGFEIQELRDDEVGHVVLNRTNDENEAVLEQP
jgi:hypothetical protein